MITFNFVIALLIASTMGTFVFFCLINCIKSFRKWGTSAVTFSLLLATVLTVAVVGFHAYSCVYECNAGTPQRQYEIKKQKVIDAEMELQKWLIAHPKFKEVHE